MKKLMFFSASLLLACTLKAQQVDVTNIPNKPGSLHIGWYDTEADFLKPGKAVYGKIVEIKDASKTSVSFTDIPPGTYAISIFFDENGNKDLDRNSFGKPKEKYGFSNNVFHAMKAASFKESAFQLKDNKQVIAIQLK